MSAAEFRRERGTSLYAILGHRMQSMSSALSTELLAASATELVFLACLLGSTVQAELKFCMERDAAGTAYV